MNTEDAATLRGQIVRAVVHSVEDAAGSQALVVETHEGVVRSGVEVLQPYGLASRPAAGGMTVLLAIGGDQGDMVALPATGGARLGVAAGEAAIYTDEGSRVHLRAGGIIEITSATELTVTIGGTLLRVSPSGVEITGNLAVTGSITASGTVSDGAGNLR